MNYQIYSGSPETSSHPKEKRIYTISDVKLGDYLTEHYDMDCQMFTMAFYKVTKSSKTTLTIDKFIYDGRQMHKPIRLSWKTRDGGGGYWENKSHRICLTTYISEQDVTIHPAMELI